jgi:lysozyme family protein
MDGHEDENFCRVMPEVLNIEAGYVNDPRDPGGPTNYGIAWNYQKGNLKLMGITDVRQLTRDTATEFYYRFFWQASDSDRIPDLDLAEIHFDAAVNCGIGQAALWLGRLSKNPTAYAGRGQNKTLFLGLCLEYLAMRMIFYTHARNRAVYLEGWINRLARIAADIAKDDDAQ